MPKSLLLPPKKGTWLFPESAVYGKDEKPVCGLCWSKLDPEWGKNKGGNENLVEELVGSQASEDYIDPTGEDWIIWEEYYKCCNPGCDARSLVRYLPSKLGFENPYHPDDRKNLKMPKKALKSYRYSEYGVYQKENKEGEFKAPSLDLGVRGVEVEVDDPWVYVNPGEMEDSIPSNWTRREDGWIKSNGKSNRFEEICKWFAARKIDLYALSDEIPILR